MAKWNPQSTHTDLAAFSDDPRVQKLVRQHRIRVTLVIVTICAIIGFGTKPTYNWFRESQINRNLEAAQTAARLGDWGQARDKARSVLLARPTDFDAYRVWHKALSEMGEPRTYMVAANLFMDPRATREDRLFALSVMARQAPQAVALSAFASLDMEVRKETAVRTAIAPLLTRRGESGVVEKMLREAPDFATDPKVRLELIRSLCLQPTAERVAEARQLFAELIQNDSSEQALEALTILGDTPGGLESGKPLPRLSDWVESQRGASTLHRLLALNPAIEAVPEASQNIFDQAVDRFLQVDPGTLGSWLLRHGKSARVVHMLTEAAKTSGPAYIVRLHALLKENNTDELKIALTQPPDSADMVELELAKAAVARIQKDPTAEKNAWNQALANAAFDQSRNRFIEIGQYAGTLGAAPVILDASVAAIRIGWGQIPLYRDLDGVTAVLAMEGRSDELLAIYRTLLRFEPMNTELINNYYYLALLHHVVSPSAASKALEELVAANPQRPEFRSALAMAYLMGEQPKLALQQLPFLAKSKRVAPLMLRGIEGCALVLSGETDRGRSILAEVNWRPFMRCESLAFREVLTALQIKDLPLPDMTVIPPAADPDQIPSWKRAVERLEKERAQDVLPALPAPVLPAVE